MLSQKVRYAAACLRGSDDERTGRRCGVVAYNPRDLALNSGDRPRSRATRFRPLAEFGRVIGQFPQRQPGRLGLVGRGSRGGDDRAVGSQGVIEARGQVRRHGLMAVQHLGQERVIGVASRAGRLPHRHIAGFHEPPPLCRYQRRRIWNRQQWGRQMDKADAAAWGSLQHSWDSAYIFEYDARPGVRKPFRVRRRDDQPRTLIAETPDELGHLIEEDYRRKPVPREVAP